MKNFSTPASSVLGKRSANGSAQPLDNVIGAQMAETDVVGSTQPPLKKKRKAKGPNPLSMRKPKKEKGKDIAAGSKRKTKKSKDAISINTAS